MNLRRQVHRIYAVNFALLFLLMGTSFAESLAPSPRLAKSLLQKLVEIPRNNPKAFAVTFATMKTSCSDILAQRIGHKRAEEGSNEGVAKGDPELRRRQQKRPSEFKLDFRRLGVFAVYGGVYLGLWQHFLFSTIYTKLFPGAAVFASQPLQLKLRNRAGVVAVMQQTSAEALIHWPWFFIPSYYVLKELCSREGPSMAHLKEVLKANWLDDNISCWIMWIPSSLVAFGALPLWMQVPFYSIVGFFYIFLLSLRRGSYDDSSDAK